MFAKFLKKKNDNKGITGKELIKLHNTPIKYASKRNDETYKEEILGREGTINVIDNEIFVVCSGKHIFKSDIYEAYASSLMVVTATFFAVWERIIKRRRSPSFG